jgi:phosphotriesterase-related protein
MLSDWTQLEYPEFAFPEGRSATAAKIAARLAELKAAGIDTLVDCTVPGHSRDTALLAAANRDVEFNIVAATGIYTYDELPFPFKRFAPGPGEGREADRMARMFLKDIREGIADTGVKAGVIKVCTDRQGVTPNIDRILRAAAVVHRMTGVPITTHTHAADKVGLDQQRILAEEGVDLSRVVIGHSGDTDDFAYLRQLLEAGSIVGADRFGFVMAGQPDLDRRVEIVATLVRDGFADQIVLSHDAVIHTDWWPDDPARSGFPADWTPLLISREVLPRLARAGVGDADIEKMLIANPARWLTPVQPY